MAGRAVLTQCETVRALNPVLSWPKKHRCGDDFRHSSNDSLNFRRSPSRYGYRVQAWPLPQAESGEDVGSEDDQAPSELRVYAVSEACRQTAESIL